MTVKKILLTGDDGYNSVGTRLVANQLKDKYTLKIAGTNTQQSGVGGMMSLFNGFEWGESLVDDVPAVWVGGTPVDAMELMVTHFQEEFDLLISGVNWGANLGATILGSGTVNAALRGLCAGVTKKAIAFSWDLPVSAYTKNHAHDESFEDYLEYPGRQVRQIVELAIAHDLWGSQLLNINFPTQATGQIRFTRPVMDSRLLFDYSSYSPDPEHQHFTYTGHRLYLDHLSAETDGKALTDGVISITPCKYDIANDQVFEQVKDLTFKLD